MSDTEYQSVPLEERLRAFDDWLMTNHGVDVTIGKEAAEEIQYLVASRRTALSREDEANRNWSSEARKWVTERKSLKDEINCLNQFVSPPPLPSDLSPVNLNGYLYQAFGMCGCWEGEEFHKSLVRILEWHNTVETREQYGTLYNENGVFYMLSGMLEKVGLVDHGISTRCAWINKEGKRLLSALKKHSPESIDKATGVDYRGIHIGNDT